MLQTKQLEQPLTSFDTTYVALCVLFAAILIACTLTYKKIVYVPFFNMHTFTLSVAVVICPIIFMLSDIVAEFYDKNRASLCVKIAIAANIVVAGLVSIMDRLTSTEWSTVSDLQFHNVFGSYGLAFISCLIACYIAQLVDINVYLYLKKLTNGKLLWLRNNGSTAVSLFVDTFIAVGLLTLIGVYPKEHVWMVMRHAYTYKLLFSICNIPLFYLIIWSIRKFILPKQP